MDSQTQITLPDGRLATVRVRSPESYLPNPRNTNRGTERGNSALIESMRQSGLHRGIVVSNDGTVINGNHAYQTASELGVATAWVEIEVEGDVGVVTRRVDWDTAQNPKAIAAALADNRTSELNFEIDPVEFAEAIAALNQAGDELPGALFSEDEISEILENVASESDDFLYAADETSKLRTRFEVLVTCHSESEQQQVLEKLMEDGHECRALIS